MRNVLGSAPPIKAPKPAAPRQPKQPGAENFRTDIPANKPTNAPLEPRQGSPKLGYTSGVEESMGAMADRLHPVKR